MSETRITVLDQLDQLEEIVLDGSRIPFSGGRLVNEQDKEWCVTLVFSPQQA
jgi:hypothetical protein